MPRYFWMLLIALISAGDMHAQQILRAEYFVDTDPGPGNGISLSLSANSAIDEILTVNALTIGMHTMGIRTMSANGFWSMPSFRFFYVRESASGILIPVETAAAEYFVDTDPGPGNAISLTLDANATIAEILPSNSLSAGMHTMGVRTLSSNGLWSIPFFRSFFVQQNASGVFTPIEIAAAEYFIDVDPGPGNGLALSINGSTSIVDIIAPGSLSLGMHFMGIRTLSTTGMWSMTVFRAFVMQAVEGGMAQPFEIIAAEYYTDQDPGLGNGIPLPITPNDSISLEMMINQLGAELGLHELSLRFKSSNGLWSATAHKSFTICTSYGPIASFTHVQNGHQMLFSSESQYTDSLQWVFHDNEVSNAPYPVKTYEPGIYPVHLTAFNECGLSNFNDTITLRGVSRLSPLTGCNLGTVSMYIYGAGFDTTTTFRLNGPDIIDGENITFNENKTLAVVQFNLLDHAIGEYAVEVGIAGINLYTHAEPFVVSDTIVGGISYVWNAQPRLRVGRARTFSLTITNSSNIDVKAIPFMMLFPANAILDEQFDIFNLTLADVNDTTTSYFVTLDSTAGEFANIKAFNGICPLLPSSRSITYSIKVKIMEQGSFLSHGFVYNINSQTPLPLGRSLVQNQVRANRDGPCAGEPDCWSSIANAVIDGLGAIPGGVGPFVACASGLAQVVATFACQSQGPLSQSEANAQAVSLMTSMGVTVANCLLATAILATPAYAAQLALLYTLRQAVSIINATGTAVSVSTSINSDLNSPSNPCFGPPPPPPGPPIIVTNSFDPNEITGINEGSFHTNETHLAYSVFFENDSSATASAVEVNVYDTLNTDLFDLSTFQLGLITFGTHRVEVPLGLTEFSTNYELGDGYLVRIRAKLDTATGVVNWNFITLDSLTMDFPEDVYYGFLPPNTNYIDGQAELKYTVSRKSTLQHGQTIPNQASIVFDFNEPVITNNWTNTLDLIAPVSHVSQIEPTDSTSFLLSCLGTDEGVGVGYYTLFVSVNDGPFQELSTKVNSSGQLLLQGAYGDTYSFYCIATDSCGNVETKEPVAEMTYTPWPDQIIASASVADVLCAGENTGSILLNLLGGDGQYTATWSNGEQGLALSNLSAGDYTVLVVDGIGNQFQSTYSVTSPSNLTVASSATPVLCYGQTSSVTLEISGGTPPYDIQWGGQDPSALLAGEYFYVVLDQNHCAFDSSILITTPLDLAVASSIVPDSNAVCFGAISLNVTGGVAPYSYAWSHDVSLNSPVAEGLCEGNYSVIVTDANGCIYMLENMMIPLGILGENTSSRWLLSPNPTRGQILLSCGGQEPIDFIDLYDADGRLVQHACSLQSTMSNGTFMLDLSKYPNGIYTIQIHTSNHRETQQVVLSRD